MEANLFIRIIWVYLIDAVLLIVENKQTKARFPQEEKKTHWG